MRKVGDNKYVATVWANQTSDSAKTQSNNFSFEGANLFSYTTQIGRLYKNQHGQTLAIIDDTRFSSTTYRQSQVALKACRVAKIKTLTVKFNRARRSGFPEINDIIPTMVELAGKFAEMALRKRCQLYKNWYRDKNKETLDGIKLVSEFFGLEMPEPDAALNVVKELQKLRADSRKEKMDRVKRWEAGEFVSLPRSSRARLRVTSDGKIQTSNHSIVEMDVAREIVFQWMYDKGFRQPWSFTEQTNRGKKVFGKYITRTIAIRGHKNQASVEALLEVGPKNCIKFFLKKNLISEANGVESPALSPAA